ncbi:MAG TPA: GTP-binding protein [Myxococcota bacterium]|nr:GTP-binding protein [Myxococcota bacterium]
MERTRILILGAAGRDFHDFNVVHRDDPSVEVVAFTATQIPGISGRRYPPELAGPLYPHGIPIEPEEELEALCRRERVARVVFAYSDCSHAEVMHAASRALACGADFELLGPARTQLRSRRPVIAVSAVRTGCGKSQTARWIVRRLAERSVRCAAIRHPMPYGDLLRQRVQRFASRDDLARAGCTHEEREEYEPYLEAGAVVFAGVDYAAILARAESEADALVWDGGNNDFPFLVPDLHIALVDALRPDQLDTHHPGESVARMADVIVINKVDAARGEDVQRAHETARRLNPRARIVRAASPVVLDDPAAVRGRRVLVVDDGPTLTHGGMAYGAGYVAAVAAGAAEIVDPRESAAPEIRTCLERHPHIGRVLPAVGYDAAQRDALCRTIAASRADVVVSGTPFDLAALPVGKPVVRARYGFAEASEPGLGAGIDAFLAERGLV